MLWSLYSVVIAQCTLYITEQVFAKYNITEQCAQWSEENNTDTFGLKKYRKYKPGTCVSEQKQKQSPSAIHIMLCNHDLHFCN